MADAARWPFRRALNLTGAYGPYGNRALTILQDQLFVEAVVITGALAAPSATLAGAVAQIVPITGALAAPSATLAGAVAQIVPITGALAAPSAMLAGAVGFTAAPGFLPTGDQRLGLLVRGQFDTGDFAIWTGQGAVTWAGVTYLGGGNLLQVGDSAASAGDEPSGLTVGLSGIDPETIAIAEAEQFQRRPVEILLGSFDAAGQITAADTFFYGLADDMDSDDSPDAPRVTLSCESRALDLGRPRPFKYLPEDQQQRFPGDTFFDLVQAIQNRESTWGR